MTKLALILHVMAGTIALLAGIVAVSSCKGARTHCVAGTVFFVSMLVMAVFADYLAVAIPEQIPNLFVGTLTIYLEGPVRIAIYTFTFIVAMAAIGDARLVLAGGVTGARRIGRHLWRMCFGLALAAGSAFTNGLPRLLPTTVHVPLILLFIPQLSALVLMVFWMIRVRFTRWYKDFAPN